MPRSSAWPSMVTGIEALFRRGYRGLPVEGPLRLSAPANSCLKRNRQCRRSIQARARHPPGCRVFRAGSRTRALRGWNRSKAAGSRRLTCLMCHPRCPSQPCPRGVVSQAVSVSMTKDNATNLFSISLISRGLDGSNAGRISSRPPLYHLLNEHGTLHPIGRPASPRRRRALKPAQGCVGDHAGSEASTGAGNLSLVASGQVDASKPRAAAVFPALSPILAKVHPTRDRSVPRSALQHGSSLCQQPLAAAVGIHHADVKLLPPLKLGERDEIAARRPGRREVAAFAMADPLHVLAVGVHDVELLRTAADRS